MVASVGTRDEHPDTVCGRDTGGGIERGRIRTDGKSVDRPMLSVVVIARNERKRIGACLDSIFEACAPLERFEVVLVDSRSTDGTVDVAREYPISVFRLPAEPVLTPSAGRYVGTAATSGDVVLFVDGDMVLTAGWLEAACRRIRDTPTLCGVDGHLNHAGVSGDREVDALRGVALYEREAIEAVGGFDPHLQSNEDIDLSYRLAAAGYRLVRLGDVVAVHPPREDGDERRRRWRHGYYHGRGELLRKYLTRPRLLARLLHRTHLYVLFFAWLGVGVFGALLGRQRGALAWTVATLASGAGASLRWGPDWTADKVANTPPVFAGVALGALGTPPDPETYPLEAVEEVEAVPPEDSPRSA